MIKAGSTYNLLIKLNITRPFNSVIFTLQSGSGEQLQLTKEPIDYTDGVFILGLTQQQTQQLDGTVKIEAQINYSDKSVDKSNILYKVISPTLATTLIEGNAPTEATMEDIDLVLQVIKGDVAILIGPDSSKELIAAITQLFEQTKAIADDIQERADNGEFDGKDYVITEDDKDEIKQDILENVDADLTEQINNAKEQVSSLTTSASKSATDARESSEKASISESNAKISATAAKESETAAATSEQNARKLTEQLTEDVSKLKSDLSELENITTDITDALPYEVPSYYYNNGTKYDGNTVAKKANVSGYKRIHIVAKPAKWADIYAFEDATGKVISFKRWEEDSATETQTFVVNVPAKAVSVVTTTSGANNYLTQFYGVIYSGYADITQAQADITQAQAFDKKGKYVPALTWVNRVNTSKGEVSATVNMKRATHEELIDVRSSALCTVLQPRSIYGCTVFGFDENKTYVSDTTLNASSRGGFFEFDVSNYCYIRIRFAAHIDIDVAKLVGSVVLYQSSVSAMPYSTLSLFNKFAVIGDSYASGEIYTADSSGALSYKDYYALSWGQIAARYCGVNCLNLSKGGLTTRTWLTSDYGLAAMQKSPVQDLYMLCLGINDAYKLGEDYLGSLDDMAIYADTFYGNYAKIIDSIKEHAPSAKIVISTLAQTDEIYVRFSEAIKQIASFYEIPCLVLHEDLFFCTNYYSANMVGGHPTATVYSGMALAYMRLLDKAVYNNLNYFADITKTGTIAGDELGLSGKVLLSFGDSIMAGDGNNGKGIADYIAEKYGMELHDYSNGGATMGVTGDNDIYTQITTAINEVENADVIIFNGGTNDIVNTGGDTSIDTDPTVPIGSLVDSIYSVENLANTSTFSGAMELGASKLLEKYPNAIIIYIRVHQMGSRNQNLQVLYGERAIEICKRWGIEFVNIYDSFQSRFPAKMRTEFLSDYTHPNKNGYEKKYLPKICSVMESMIFTH